MLDTRRYDLLRRHLAEVTVELGRAFRDSVPPYELGWQVSALLLSVACRMRASTSSGNPPPESLSPGSLGLSDNAVARVQAVLDREADWLAENPEFWADYGSELLRTTADRWHGNVLTSRALQQVVEAVLTATPMDVGRDRVGVLDIACGGATLLAAAADVFRERDVSLAGQDINDGMLAVARQNLYLAGYQARLVQQDVLAADEFVDQMFDFVVADAPLGMRWTPEHGIAEGYRFPFGVPSKTDAALLFLQALLAKVKTADEGGGLAVMFTGATPSAAGRPGERAIRQAITDLDILQAVIALPEGLNVTTGIRLYALVLNTAKSAGWRDKTQLVDLRGQFETSLLGPERRHLNATALREITRALSSPKPSTHTRTVTREQFAFQRARVSLAQSPVGLENAVRRQWSFMMLAPVRQDLVTWRAARYGGLGRPPEVTVEPGTEVRWDIDAVLPSASERELSQTLQAIQWPSSRLINFVESAEYLRSHRAPDRADKITALRDEQRLVLPLEPHFDAAYGPAPEVVVGNRCMLIALFPDLQGSFLAAWLNSPAGRRSRAAAIPMPGGSPRTVSPSDWLRMLDRLVVPVPKLDVQAAVADAARSLRAAQQRVEQLRADLWRTPDEGIAIQRTTRRWLESGDLAAWATSLPYPLSSSLQAFEALKGDDERAARQLIRFWEAFATFFATYLLSALRQDISLWEPGIPQIRRTLERVGCDFDRATLGTWRIVVERLTRLFRTGLSSDDPDEVRRYAQLLGNPPADLRDRLMNPRLVGVLSDVNALRNNFDGHGGTMNRQQAAELRATLEEKTNELRDLVGFGWSDFRLVRPDSMRYRHGRYLIAVEVLVGPVFPFRTDQIYTDRALEDSQLHLVSETGDVPLVPLVVVISSCYFYNRREPFGARFVAYSMADENEVLLTEDHVLRFLDELKVVAPPAVPQSL